MTEPRSTALGVINATAAPLVAAAICSGADIHPAAPAGIAAAVGTGVLARNWLSRIRVPWSEAAFKAAMAIGGGAWAAWSTVTGPWQVTNLAVGAGAAIVGTLLAPAFLADDPESTGAPAAVTEGPCSDSRAVEWKPRIERICRVKPITITAVEDWPNGAGYTLQVQFAPESGDTWRSIDAHTIQLAGAVFLPKGCVIGVAEGDRQGTAEVRVPTVNALGATDVWMSDQVRRASILDDHAIAICDDTSDAVVNLRQEAGLIVSMRGGGKTNLLNRLICRLLECEDNLTWIVDLNGGGLAVPFLMPWIDGQVQRCPIDAIAVDEKTALLMAQAASAIARDRKARYARLKARANTDLLPVSPQLPQITIVIDESAEVYERAPKAMAALLEVQRIGRAEAVNVIFSALRGTQDTVPVPVRKQATLKVCGKVESDGELDYVIPGSRLRSADLLYAGTMYLSRGNGVRQVKVHRTSPELIAAVVCATASWRAALDAPAAAVAGDWYATRWQKLDPWLAVLRGDATTEPTAASVPAQPGGGPAAAAGAARQTVHTEPRPARVEPTSPAERAAARQAARDGLRRFIAREQAKERVEQLRGADLRTAFDDVIAGLDAGQAAPAEKAPAAGDGPTPDGQTTWSPQLLIDIVTAHPGITPTGMAEQLAARGITVSPKTLYKWLERYVDQGVLRRDAGKYELAQ